MSDCAQLKRLNKEVETMLDSKDFKNPSLKSNIKQIKKMIFTNSAIVMESSQYLMQAVKFSEFNLLLALQTGKDKDIQLAIEKVKFFYENPLLDSKSQNHDLIFAIQLIALVAGNRSQEFYTKLETLSYEQLNKTFVVFVHQLNDALEQGNYQKVLKLKQGNPSPYFAPFLEQINQTLKIQLLKYAETGYHSLNVADALQMFQLGSQQELTDLINSYIGNTEDPQTKWIVENGKIHFLRKEQTKSKLNSEELIKTAINYAYEIEKIV